MAGSASGLGESNSALWLATLAGKIELSCPPHEKRPRKPYYDNNSFIDQVFFPGKDGWICAGYGPRLRLGP